VRHTRNIVTHHGGPDALEVLEEACPEPRAGEGQKIKPLIARRFPLAEARQAQELLGKGGVTGTIVLVCDGSSVESGAV
jgi:hypothetical protein